MDEHPIPWRWSEYVTGTLAGIASVFAGYGNTPYALIFGLIAICMAGATFGLRR